MSLLSDRSLVVATRDFEPCPKGVKSVMFRYMRRKEPK